MRRTLYLVRHGEIGHDATGRYIGQTDLPLSPAGRLQARRLAAALADMPVDAIYASDLRRTRQTARLIAAPHGLTPAQRPGLREIALGDWEGLARDDVATRYPEQYAARGRDIVGYRVPGGESFADCLTRALGVWQEILASEQREVIVVAHAGINRLLLCHALGLPLTGLMNIPQRYGCLNIVRVDQGRCEALAINRQVAPPRCHKMTQPPFV